MGLAHETSYFIPSHLPSFIRRPPRDNGIPVFFDTRRFALVTPSARFHENDKPGPSFTAPPESPPNLPHLVHIYICVKTDARMKLPPRTPTRANEIGILHDMDVILLFSPWNLSSVISKIEKDFDCFFKFANPRFDPVFDVFDRGATVK